MQRRICAYLLIASVPEAKRLWHRMWYLLHTEGVSCVAAAVARKLCGQPRSKTAGRTLVDEVLHLEAGDLVEVKSPEEIRMTLDASQKTRGLLFMPEMWKFCGKHFRVYKKVNMILVESTGEQRHPKNTVLLEGVHCDGSMHSNCDSSCFHFWREIWLKKAASPSTADERLRPSP